MQDKKENNSGVKDAIERFNSAIDALETSIDGYLESNRTIQEAETEVQQVNMDRNELADRLDSSEARSARLEDINKEVSRRLVAAMESIRNVVDTKQGE